MQVPLLQKSNGYISMYTFPDKIDSGKEWSQIPKNDRLNREREREMVNCTLIVADRICPSLQVKQHLLQLFNFLRLGYITSLQNS